MALPLPPKRRDRRRSRRGPDRGCGASRRSRASLPTLQRPDDSPRGAKKAPCSCTTPCGSSTLRGRSSAMTRRHSTGCAFPSVQTRHGTHLQTAAPLALGGRRRDCPFQQYFSSRELAGVSRLILVPFIAEEKLIAVLLLSEIDSPLEPGRAPGLPGPRREAGAPRVHEARAAQAAAAGSAGADLNPWASRIEPSRFIASVGASRKTVFSCRFPSRSIQRVSSRRTSTWIHSGCTRTFPISLAPFSPMSGRFFRCARDGSFSRSRISIAAELDLFMHQLHDVSPRALRRQRDAVGRGEPAGPRLRLLAGRRRRPGEPGQVTVRLIPP